MSNGRNAQTIGGWSAQQNGLEFGKHIEYVVESLTTQKGGRFDVFEIFKPYVIRSGPNAGQVGRGHSLPFPDGHRQLVDKINHMIMNFGAKNGQYVFQPTQSMQQGQYGAPPAPQYGNPPVPQYAPNQPAYPAPAQPGYGAPPQPVYQQPQAPQGGTGYAPPQQPQAPQQPLGSYPTWGSKYK